MCTLKWSCDQILKSSFIHNFYSSGKIVKKKWKNILISIIAPLFLPHSCWNVVNTDLSSTIKRHNREVCGDILIRMVPFGVLWLGVHRGLSLAWWKQLFPIKTCTFFSINVYFHEDEVATWCLLTGNAWALSNALPKCLSCWESRSSKALPCLL